MYTWGCLWLGQRHSHKDIAFFFFFLEEVNFFLLLMSLIYKAKVSSEIVGY